MRIRNGNSGQLDLLSLTLLQFSLRCLGWFKWELQTTNWSKHSILAAVVSACLFIAGLLFFSNTFYMLEQLLLHIKLKCVAGYSLLLLLRDKSILDQSVIWDVRKVCFFKGKHFWGKIPKKLLVKICLAKYKNFNKKPYIF